MAAQSLVSSAPLFPGWKKALTGGSQGQYLVQEVIRGLEPQESNGCVCFAKELVLIPLASYFFPFWVSVLPSIKRTCWIRGTLFSPSSDTKNICESNAQGHLEVMASEDLTIGSISKISNGRSGVWDKLK